jgi:hypothetical protein
MGLRVLLGPGEDIAEPAAARSAGEGLVDDPTQISIVSPGWARSSRSRRTRSRTGSRVLVTALSEAPIARSTPFRRAVAAVRVSF